MTGLDYDGGQARAAAEAATRHGVTHPRAACATSCPPTSGAATYVIASIRGVYERYGFEPLETPAVENIETLLGKYGEEGNSSSSRSCKRGEHEASAARPTSRCATT